jgi:hypothetical protein
MMAEKRLNALLREVGVTAQLLKEVDSASTGLWRNMRVDSANRAPPLGPRLAGKLIHRLIDLEIHQPSADTLSDAL